MVDTILPRSRFYIYDSLIDVAENCQVFPTHGVRHSEQLFIQCCAEMSGRNAHFLDISGISPSTDSDPHYIVFDGGAFGSSSSSRFH